MSKEASLWFLAVAIIIGMLVYAVQRMIARDALKRKYTGKLTFGTLFSADSGLMMPAFSISESLLVSSDGFVCFINTYNGNNVIKRSVMIKLGANDYFYSYGPKCMACIFRKTSVVRLYANGLELLSVELADCKVSGNSVTGFDENGSDHSLAFGQGLTVTVLNY